MPQRRHILATRRSKDRFGGAAFEVSGAYRVDLLSGLERLPAETRGLLKLRMTGLSARAMGRRLDVCTSTVYRRMDRAIGDLTEAMNNLGGSMATATKATVNGTQQQEELERLQQAIVRKLLALPPGWEQVVVKRGVADFTVKVLY